MAYSKIMLGVGKYSNTGRVLFQGVHNPPDALKEEVLKRDKYTCRFCGFNSIRYQEVVFVGEGVKPKEDPRKEMTADNYLTACSFCHQCFHIDKIEHMQSGTLIWLPEIGQAALNHIARAIYIARISRGPMADASKIALDTLMKRKQEAEKILGTGDTKVLASVLGDFLEAGEYRNRNEKLGGFRILPLDRRIIIENGLEFNQFPQVLAYWRSNQGPFGSTPSRDWLGLFAKANLQTTTA